MKILPFPIGFEMTGIPHSYKEIRPNVPDPNCENRMYEASEHVRCDLDPKYPGLYIQRDIHCVEVPSPVFGEMSKIKEFYLDVRKSFARRKITPKRDFTVDGGNHINCQVPAETIRKVYRDMVNRPYIPWVFTEPDDTDSCDNLTKLGNQERAAFSLIQQQRRPDSTFYYVQSYYPYYHGLYWVFKSRKNDFCGINGNHYNKRFALSFKLRNKYALNKKTGRVWPTNSGTDAHTLEFRCVEAPMDFGELQDQLEFFIRYVKYVNKRRLLPPPTLPSKKYLMTISKEWCAKEFKDLLKKLGLNPRRYQKYINRNLYARWTLGRKRV